MNVAFFIRQFGERGTEVSTYNYAKYNEEILHNRSFILCFTPKKQKEVNLSTTRVTYDRFVSRFPTIEIDDIAEIGDVIDKHVIQVFYTQAHGGGGDIYDFGNNKLWGKCKTVKHCVFDTTFPEGDFYLSISETLCKKNNTSIPVIPYIVDYFPDNHSDLRKELNIPQDAVVLGRHGADTEFDIPMAQQAVMEFLALDATAYFLFLNTRVFYKHPRVIHLDKNTDLAYKARFIDTCDAMLHARAMGETFGLAVAEFSIRNKPVITCPCGDMEHIKILGDRSVQYNSKLELLDILKNFRPIAASRNDWNAYQFFSPENVMRLLDRAVFSKVNVNRDKHHSRD